MIELGTITRVFTSETNGGQLVNIKSHVSDREYKEVELLMPRGITALPNVGNLVAFSEINNNVIVCFGIIEQADLGLSEGEVLIHRGLSSNYTIVSQVKINKDNEIILESGIGGVTPAKIIMKPTGEVELHCSTFNVI